MSWLRGGRSQLVVVPLGPGSQILSRCHHWGSQVPNPTGPQAPQATYMEEGSSCRLRPSQTATAIRLQRLRWGEVHRCLKAWAEPVVALMRDLEPCRTQHPACYLGPLVHLASDQQVSLGAPERRPGSIHLLLCLPDDHQPPLHRPLTDGPTKDRSLTAGHLVEGPTAVLAHGWVGPLRVLCNCYLVMRWGILEYSNGHILRPA